MAFQQTASTSLTQSHPAPVAPHRPGTDNGAGYTTDALANSTYNSPFMLMPASPSGSSHDTFPYSGVDGSPNHRVDDLDRYFVRCGPVSMKEDSFGNWLFQRKWLNLKERTLSIHKSSAAPPQSVIRLRDISNVERIDMNPYCLLLEAQGRRYFITLKNDEELYGWLDDLYTRSPLTSKLEPTNFRHNVHVRFDPVSRELRMKVVPEQQNKFSTELSISEESDAQDQEAVLDALQFDADHQEREMEDMPLVSTRFGAGADFRANSTIMGVGSATSIPTRNELLPKTNQDAKAQQERQEHFWEQRSSVGTQISLASSRTQSTEYGFYYRRMALSQETFLRQSWVTG